MKDNLKNNLKNNTFKNNSLKNTNVKKNLKNTNVKKNLKNTTLNNTLNTIFKNTLNTTLKNTLKNNTVKKNLKNNIFENNILENNILENNVKNILENNVKNTVKNNLNNNKTNIELNNNNNNYIKNRNIHIDKDKLFDLIGILDPEGFHNNPFTNEPYTNVYYNPEKEISKENPTYLSLSKNWSNFPMYGIREESIKTLYDNQVILVVSGTGSGKTVLTPKFLLHIFNYQGRIAITNPKRIPTKENAVYAAKCMDVKLGSYVGTKYRNSDKKDYSSKCKLIYATDGWILQKLQKDPMLSDLDAVIIDEAHERGIQIDLLLLALKELLKKRPEFKLVIMSATVNESIFIDYFPKNKFKFGLINAGVYPNYPIEEFFLDKPINKFDNYGCLIKDMTNKNYINVAVDKVIDILKKHEIGDILVFFPGKGDTSDGCSILHQKLDKLNKNLEKKIFCNILTSTTDSEVQKLIVDPSKYKESGVYTRKVVFSTEVAESSITIDGIDFIIDSGLVNNDIFSAEKNMKSLKKEYISKASHKQRKGRTGRTSPGTCFCLFTKDEYEKKFIEYAIPPILSEDISAILLRFLSDLNIISHINYPIKYKKISNKINNTEPKELAHY
jgi:pre-mRNA-splicing factor ATP-dependent RNA helicase DHX15/PRP43